MSDIENLQSIIRKKNNDLFNLQIKALKDDDFSRWESAVQKMALLREFETRLTLIAVEIRALNLEVEEIADKIDQV